MCDLTEQWIYPTVHNTFTNSDPPTISWLIERTLKLSLPNNVLCTLQASPQCACLSLRCQGWRFSTSTSMLF